MIRSSQASALYRGLCDGRILLTRLRHNKNTHRIRYCNKRESGVLKTNTVPFIRIDHEVGTRIKVLSFALLCAGFASQNFAQTGTTTTVAPALEEIVVTAQKRAQSINDVGMAINAVNDDALRQQGIKGVGGPVKIEPRFTVSQAQYGTPVYSVRGVGYNEASLAASPAVSVY